MSKNTVCLQFGTTTLIKVGDLIIKEHWLRNEQTWISLYYLTVLLESNIFIAKRSPCYVKSQDLWKNEIMA